MWKCHNCGRIFDKQGQVHSCKVIPLGEHFKHKDTAKTIFDALFKTINDEIGVCKVISIPCCIHLYGKYDFVAVLPKKDRLEIRFGLNRTLDSPRLKQAVPVSQSSVKICIDLITITDIDKELIAWLKESYHLRDK